MISSEEKDRGWFRWRPAAESELVYSDIARAIAEFKPKNKGAGKEAAEWLKEKAISDYPASATWVFYDNGRIEGFFSICSGNFKLRERAIKDRLPGGGMLKPASEITWLCKHAEAVVGGQWLLMRATSIAREVAKIQGNIALVINPYDGDTARMLREKHSFLEEDPRSGKLWLPLPVPIPL